MDAEARGDAPPHLALEAGAGDGAAPAAAVEGGAAEVEDGAFLDLHEAGGEGGADSDDGFDLEEGLGDLLGEFDMGELLFPIRIQAQPLMAAM